jgi:hypothetical protein
MRLERVRSRNVAFGHALLEAGFVGHGFERHMHATYALAVTLSSVQRFGCAGVTHDSRPGDVITIEPASAHDGQSGTADGFEYRMLYIPADTVGEILSDALGRPRELHFATPLLHDPMLARCLYFGSRAGGAQCSCRRGVAASLPAPAGDCAWLGAASRRGQRGPVCCSSRARRSSRAAG